MGKNRYFSTDLWKDEWFLDLSGSARFAYVYLLTGPDTTISGVYRFSPRRAAFDCGMTLDEMKAALATFEETGKAFLRLGYIILPSWPEEQHYRERPTIEKGIRAELDALPEDVRALLPELGYRFPVNPASYTARRVPAPEAIREPVRVPAQVHESRHEIPEEAGEPENSIDVVPIPQGYDTHVIPISYPSHIHETPVSYPSHTGIMSNDSDSDFKNIKKERAHTRMDEVQERRQVVPPPVPPAPEHEDFQDRLFQALLDADGFFLPGEIGNFRSTFKSQVLPFITGIEESDILTAVENLGKIAAAPAGKYFWDRKVTPRAFFERHLARFLPGQFHEADFLPKTPPKGKPSSRERIDEPRTEKVYPTMKGPEPVPDEDVKEIEAVTGGDWMKTFRKATARLPA